MTIFAELTSRGKFERRVLSASNGQRAIVQEVRDGHITRITDVKQGQFPALVLLKAGVNHHVAIALGR